MTDGGWSGARWVRVKDASELREGMWIKIVGSLVAGADVIELIIEVVDAWCEYCCSECRAFVRTGKGTVTCPARAIREGRLFRLDIADEQADETTETVREPRRAKEGV